MTKADWLAKVKAGLPGSYKRFQDIERDRRFTDAERLEVLAAWPAVGDFEKAQLAATMQAIRERIGNG